MSEVRTHHDEFMKKARVVFSRADEGFDLLRDPQNMFAVEVDDGKPPVYHKRMFGLVTNQLDAVAGDQSTAPYQDVELYQQRLALEREDSERLQVSLLSPIISLYSDGNYSLDLPSISGIGGELIGKYGDNLSVITELGQDMTLHAAYSKKEGKDACLSNLFIEGKTGQRKGIIGGLFDIVLRDEGYALRYDGDSKPIHMDRMNSYFRYGRIMDLEPVDDHFELTFHMLEGKGVDFMLKVPLVQKTEKIIDHTGEYVYRYLWEDDVLDETLRKDPSQPYAHISDQKWLRANVKTLLGIKLLKSNPAPQEEEKEQESF